MLVKTLSREESRDLFEKYLSYGEIPDDFVNNLPAEYLSLRKKMIKIENSYDKEDAYQFDLQFALKLYDFLNNEAFFNETVAEDNDFWRYLCMCVVPDLVARRHGLVASYFYEKPGRIYLQAMWWFIHMSYQGSTEKTYEALKSLNTDYILQLVERKGRDGFYLEVTREIIHFISILPIDIVNKRINKTNLFRRVLIQNTAKQDNYNLTVDGKANTYVKALFKACKVEVNKYE